MARDSSQPPTPAPITATGPPPSSTKAAQRVAKGPRGLAATACSAKPGRPGMADVMPTSIDAMS